MWLHIKQIGYWIFNSFPVKLLLLHIKKHLYLNFVWLLLFLILFESLGKQYGVPLLLLDPELFGKVNFLSFFVVGIAMGGFMMTWNVCVYILDVSKFDFIVYVSKPFTRFVLNNTILPLIFTIVYVIKIFLFQSHQGLQGSFHIFLHIVGLILGNICMIILYSIYFIFFAEDIKTFIEKLSNKSKENLERKNIKLDIFDIRKGSSSNKKWKVEHYWYYPWRVYKVSDIPIYDQKLIDAVYYLHHRNIFAIIVISLTSLIALGFLMDYLDFSIPAGATLFLLLTVFSVVFTLFLFWFKSWITIAFLGVIFILNILTRYDLVVYKNKIFGLKYDSKVSYNYNVIEAQSNDSNFEDDKIYTEQILNNWKNKNQNKRKPKLVILNVGGGGSKAAYWTFHVIQKLNQATKQKLFKRTVLISGASGGMYGSAYYRELYLQAQKDTSIHLDNAKYLDNIGKDLLNAVMTSASTNDIFYPFRKVNYGSIRYNKDRAYYFDREFNKNTNFILDKKLMDYKLPESNADIPMMVIGSTIIEDQRMMYFSPQPISYLLKPYIHSDKINKQYTITDAIEFMRYFKNNRAEDVGLVCALRTGATYPYILPSVSMPTEPRIYAMDAGFRDNYGYIVTARYMNAFKDWIEANTSGVIVVTIKSNERKEHNKDEKHTYIGELLSPIGGIYSNMFNLQNYNADQSFAIIFEDYKTKINFIDFIYIPSEENNKASLSWHLTEKEKRDILNSYNNATNQQMEQKLLELLY